MVNVRYISEYVITIFQKRWTEPANLFWGWLSVGFGFNYNFGLLRATSGFSWTELEFPFEDFAWLGLQVDALRTQ